MYEDEDYDVVPYDEEENFREEQEAERQHQARRLYGETIGGVLNAVTEYARTLEQEKRTGRMLSVNGKAR